MNRITPNIRVWLHGAGVVWLVSVLIVRALTTIAPVATAATAAEWQSFEHGRFIEVTPKGTGRIGFTTMTPDGTGVTFTNHLSDALAATNRLLEDGAGVAAGDIDGDGLVDLYFCRTEGSNVLYRNLGDWRFEDVSDGSGVRCPDQPSTGAAFADLDGDGDLDLIVNGLGAGTRAFGNRGDGTFVEWAGAGFDRSAGSRSLALADVDQDGDLDVYVVNYRTTTRRDKPVRVRLRRVGNTLQVEERHRGQFVAVILKNGTGSLIEIGEPDRLYLNDGGGRFSPVSWVDGQFLDENGDRLQDAPREWGLTAMFRDWTGDGVPDLYVCGDFISRDRIWIGLGGGRFRAAPGEAVRKTSWASMAVDFADIDRDGDDDFFLADMLSRSHRNRLIQRSLVEQDMNPDWGWGWRIGDVFSRPQVMRNGLYLNRGDNTFAEIAQMAGLEATEWTWGLAFCDIDLDGFDDLLVANGHAHDLVNSDTVAAVGQVTRNYPPDKKPSTLHMFARLPLTNLAFRNGRDLTFQETGAEWGFAFNGISNGMALADLDNDGDSDVVLNNLFSAASLLRNDSVAPRIGVRLRGGARNVQGIGSRITVRGGPVVQANEIVAAGRYLSADDPMRAFAAGGTGNGAGAGAGAGATAASLSIDVAWPDGARTVVHAATPNRIYELRHPGETSSEAVGNRGVESPARPAQAVRADADAGTRTWFEDVSPLLNHMHRELEFDDWGRQPLLTRQMSLDGPGVAWLDLNSDGWDDLVIGSGRGGLIGIYTNQSGTSFRRIGGNEATRPAAMDQTGVVGWPRIDGAGQDILVGLSNYETSAGGDNGGGVLRIDSDAYSTAIVVPNAASGASVGPIAAADLDGDGDLDLFVGGRAIPGRYPAPADSFVYRNDDGQLAVDPANSGVLASVGLVRGAVWTDLNDDGWPDLALACEWGAVRLFQNRNGQLDEVTAAWGLAPWKGFWTGVTAGDFDGDGRMDLAAANWGTNTHQSRFLDHGWHIYHGKLAGDDPATYDIIEAYRPADIEFEVPWRDWNTAAKAIPFLRRRYASYSSYADSSLQEIYGNALNGLSKLSLTTLESAVFLNRGRKFERVPLPLEAQRAPAWGVQAADFDGDGREDLFLSQNCFAVHHEISRYDAGRGLLLTGKGDGTFDTVPGQQSGIRIYGDQRGSAAGDFDRDGRVDLVVSQNGAETILLRNRHAPRGHRIRLAGGGGNPAGVGAVVRLIDNQGVPGPAREIHSGSGYWSQDSLVPVLHSVGAHDDSTPAAVQVRWPGGRTTKSPWPDSRNVVVYRDGRCVPDGP